jgi:hypothetical protein
MRGSTALSSGKPSSVESLIFLAFDLLGHLGSEPGQTPSVLRPVSFVIDENEIH